jgi:hypothetical protein
MYPPNEEVEVYRGAWNTGHHWGGDFLQWNGSLIQKKGLDELWNCSAYYQNVKRAFDQRYHELNNPEEVRQYIIDGYDHILLAETSCNFYWGSAWVHKAFDNLEKAYSLFDTAMSRMNE